MARVGIIRNNHKVGISSGGVSVECMQEDRFSRTELYINENTEERSSPTAVTISSLKHVHYGSATIGNLNIKVP